MEYLILLIGISNIMESKKNKQIRSLKSCKLAVIGLGYVGLPLAVEFGKYR